MAIKTKIEWCDSTLNLQAGCDGCELWNPKTGVAACYAGTLTQRWAGRPGWPDSFDQPKIFLERLPKALAWPDLTGTDRPDKPWLNGLPRIIFLNDMGDSFTESMPLGWLSPAIEQMSETPHRWLILTKRPKRMYRFFKEYGRIPWNFWLLTSATDQATWDARVPELIRCREINPQVTLGVSCEPLLGPIDMHADGYGIGTVTCHRCGKQTWLNMDVTECPWCGGAEGTTLNTINWIIAGGESGAQARVWNPAWARQLLADCIHTETAFFWKQNGEWAPFDNTRQQLDAAKDKFWMEGAKPELMLKLGKVTAGRLLDGWGYSQMPEVAL